MRRVAGVYRSSLLLLVTFLWILCPPSLTSGSLHQKHTVTLNENIEANLLFNAPAFSENCTYSLSYKGVTFNNNGSEIFSHAYPHAKLLRTSVHAQFAFGYLGVSLSIGSLHREDKGNYQCTFTCDKNIVAIQNTQLHIYYPPSQVDCAWRDKKDISLEAANYFNLSVLQCTATNGYPIADIICYSNGEHHTRVHTPLHITGHHVITATFWLKDDQHLSCCSVSSKFTKSIQECNDYQPVHYTSQASTKRLETTTVTSQRTEQEIASSTTSNQGILQTPSSKAGTIHSSANRCQSSSKSSFLFHKAFKSGTGHIFIICLAFLILL